MSTIEPVTAGQNGAVAFVTALGVCPACHADGRRGDRRRERSRRQRRSLDLSLREWSSSVARAERSPFLGDELSAGSLSGGNDLVEVGKDTRRVYTSSANFSPDSAGRDR